MSKLIYSITILFFLNFGHASANGKLNLESLQDSVLKNHPLILEELEKIEQVKGEFSQAQGGFDATLKSKISDRTDGYYQGDYSQLKVLKPLKYLNSEIYLQYNNSQNNLPVYEQEFETSEDAEVSLGFKMSLLRYRDIDQRRLKLRNSKIEMSIAQEKLNKAKQVLNMFVYQAYWNWVLSMQIVDVYKDLLIFSQTRDKGIRERAKKGDLANIYIIENTQYLLKRKNQLEKAKQMLFKNQQIISLLWRDNSGKRKKVDNSLINKSDLLNLNLAFLTNNRIRETINKLPQIVIYNNKIKKINNKLLQADNYLKPKLDLEIISSNGGARNLENNIENENKILLKLEVPIERNLGKGKISKLKAQKKQLEQQKIFFIDKILTGVENLKFQLESTKLVINNYKKEINFAQQLQDAEREKIKNGGSDFFILNIREQNTANSKIDLLSTKQKFVDLYAKYALMEFGILKSYKI